MWFEQSYIKDFIKDPSLAGDYLVTEGFQSNNQERPYDVDLVILDKSRSKLFLVQVKYHRRFRYYSWEDEINDLFQHQDSGILKGYRQLQGARKEIMSPRIRDQIVNRLGIAYSPTKLGSQNIHYVLLHTVTSLDYASIEGVSFYEWNSFRNLLRRGSVSRVQVSPEGILRSETVREEAVVPIEDPGATFELKIRRVLDDPSGPGLLPHDDLSSYKIAIRIPDPIEKGSFKGHSQLTVITPSI